MKAKYWSLFIEMIFPVIVMSQTKQIQGHVTDLSGHPIEFASVEFYVDRDSIANSLILTDSSGLFVNSLPSKGRYRIEISAVNYSKHSAVVQIYNDTVINIKLISLPQQLETVTVTSQKPFIEYKANKITLNIASNPVTTGDDAYHVLLKAPGVSEINGNLNFRTKSVLILIDDKPTHLTDDELKEMLSSMSAANIEKIEILPNPSAKYDASGGSIINIILAKSKTFGANGTLTSGFSIGTYCKYNFGLDMNYRNKKLNVYSGIDFSHSKLFYDNTFNRTLDQYSSMLQTERQIVVRTIPSGKIGIDYDIDKKNALGLLIKNYTTYRNRTVNNLSILKNLLAHDSSSTVATNGDAQAYNPSVNLYYKTILDTAGKELLLNIDCFEYSKYWNDNIVTNYFNASGQQYFPPYYLKDNSPAKITNWSTTIDYTYPSKIGKFGFGLKSQYTICDNNIKWQENNNGVWSTDTSLSNHFIYRENINAGYVTFNKTSPHYNLEIGTRIEETSSTGDLINDKALLNRKNYWNVFPSTSFEYVKNQNNIFDFSYRISIQRFGFNIVNPFVVYQSQYSVYQGNPNIEPELDHNFELSYTYKQALSVGTSYTRGIKPLAPIFLKGNGNEIISTYANLKSYDFFYVYADFTYPFTKWWTSYISAGTGFLQYNTSTDSLNGQYNKSSWSYLIQTQNTFNLGNGYNAEITAYWRGPYVSGIYKAMQYFTSSAGFSKVLLKDKLTVKIAVQNIFNSDKQRLNVSYQGIELQSTNKTETRFFNLSISYRFGNKNVKQKKERESNTEDVQKRIN